MPFHLVLPLVASLVFVVGLLLIKKANANDINPWTVTFTANLLIALLFSSFTLVGDYLPTANGADEITAGFAELLPKIWQPALIALCFVAGQIFTFAAISRGDVSVATPILSIKVLLVAVFLMLLSGEQVTYTILVSAALATVGIALVQISGSGSHHHIWSTVAFALAAPVCFALHDVLVQLWAGNWPTTWFLPIVFSLVAIMSLCLLPAVQNPLKMERPARILLAAGAFCIAFQAFCLVSSLSLFHDATRINIVFSLRGLWGVLLAFLLAKRFGIREMDVGRHVIIMRLFGASLLTVAVILAIAFG